MLTIRVEGFKELKNTLDAISAKQVPFATAKAITKTAKSIEVNIQREMARVFKSASPYVRRSTFATVATKSNLSATIGLKDYKPANGTAPSVLLKEHFIGGLRGNKPFEKALISMKVMPPQYRAIPGSGIRRDSYGNPNRKDIGEMLGALKTGLQVYKGRGKKMITAGYFVVFVGSKNRMHPGVYKRVARGKVDCMFIFVDKASYQKVINLEYVADSVVRKDFQSTFDAAFSEALRTAK